MIFKKELRGRFRYLCFIKCSISKGKKEGKYYSELLVINFKTCWLESLGQMKFKYTRKLEDICVLLCILYQRTFGSSKKYNSLKWSLNLRIHTVIFIERSVGDPVPFFTDFRLQTLTPAPYKKNPGPSSLLRLSSTDRKFDEFKNRLLN